MCVEVKKWALIWSILFFFNNLHTTIHVGKTLLHEWSLPTLNRYSINKSSLKLYGESFMTPSACEISNKECIEMRFYIYTLRTLYDPVWYCKIITLIIPTKTLSKELSIFWIQILNFGNCKISLQDSKNSKGNSSRTLRAIFCIEFQRNGIDLNPSLTNWESSFPLNSFFPSVLIVSCLEYDTYSPATIKKEKRISFLPPLSLIE